MVGCSNGSEDIDWTRGVYCESTQAFLYPGMTRSEMEQILGEGELLDQVEESYIILYRSGGLRVVYHEGIADIIAVLDEGYLVFGLSYGSSLQEMLDALGRPCEVFYGRDRRRGGEDLYGYDNLDDFNLRITFAVDPEEARVVGIEVFARR
jgi:hypothetical protein